jgi:hypothetical protein
MTRGLYSDKFLKGLLENEPKVAKEFLEMIANTEYVNEDEVISCVDVPGWVLEKAGVKACRNPNFPSREFEKLLANEEVVVQNFWEIFRYPHLSKEQIKKLMRSGDVNVRGLALVHPLGDSSELLEYMNQIISEKNKNSHVISYICRNVNLSDEVFSYLYSVHDYELYSTTIGQDLLGNPTLTEEHKALLVLSGIQPKDESTYWGGFDIHFISSIPYFQSLRTTFGSYKRQKVEAIPIVNKKVEEFFSKSGHHLSAVLPVDQKVDIEVSIEGLREMIDLELLHRMFWTDLCERADFEIYRRNAYRTDDLFISHPILGREFEEADAEDATQLGGVLFYNNQNWLQGSEELPADQAAHELLGNGTYDSLVAKVEDTFYENLGQALIALTYGELSEKYGFEITENGWDWMIEAALESAESDSFEVFAELNPDFGETLSWQKLPDKKKETVFEFLNLGYQEKDSKLRSDSIHFLGCMALHEGTPKSILKKLGELGDPLITEVLATRKI